MSLIRVRVISSNIHQTMANTNETDSLAGQMSALKTGGITGAPPSKKKKKPVEESSDEESNTDEEDDTSETDTDTDTDGE